MNALCYFTIISFFSILIVTKLGLWPIKALRNGSFKDSVNCTSPMVETTATYQNFTRFTLIPYLLDYPLYKNQAAKFPAILDCFYSVSTISGEFQHGWVAEARLMPTIYASIIWGIIGGQKHWEWCQHNRQNFCASIIRAATTLSVSLDAELDSVKTTVEIRFAAMLWTQK